MHPVAVFDIIYFLASLLGLFFIFRGPRRTFPRGTRLLLGAVLSFTVLYSLCLEIEWLDITKALDRLEDFIGALLPMWWGFVFYSFVKEMSGREMRESEKRFRMLVEQAADAFFLHDFEGKIIDVNQRACESLGYEREELLGLRVWDVDVEFESHNHKERYWKGLAPERPVTTVQGVHRRKDGSTFPVEVRLGLLELGGQGYILALARDISQRKEVEEERERLLTTLALKNEELEGIISVSSHDLRAPLVNIEGYSDLLTESCRRLEEALDKVQDMEQFKQETLSITNDDIPTSLKYICLSARKIDSLQRALLKLCRLGSAALQREALDMNGLLQEIVDSMQYQIDRRGATVTIETLPDCYGDRTQIGQVFTNLLDNALKYLGPDREGHLRVTGKVDGGMSVYCVEDNGIGIDPKYYKKVFEIFHQLNPNESQDGEGMGLTIARRVIDRHEGTIWLESQPGQGSRFYISLPTCNQIEAS